MPRAARTRLPAWLGDGAVIAAAMGVMNLGTYGFTIAAARVLGPADYGALAAVMGLLLVLNVMSLGLQATGARRVSAAPADRAETETAVMATSYRAALTLGVLTLLAAPVVTAVLRLDSWATAGLLALTTVPLTVMGGQAGVFQGERRWFPLAGIYLAVGLGRVGFGVAGLLWRPDATGAMLGVAVGAFVPALIGWWFLRHPARGMSDKEESALAAAVVAPPRPRGRLLPEVARNSHALLAFFALSNVDVIIARSVLPDQQSGLYAGGLILAKAVLFLPQFVVVIAFPAMSAAGVARSMHLKGLGLVLGIGTCATVGAWLLSPLAVEFVGGDAYDALESRVWAFAAVGTLLAMTQVMVYSVVARQHQRSVYVLWAGLLVLLALAPVISSVTFLVTSVATVLTVVLGVLVAVSLRR